MLAELQSSWLVEEGSLKISISAQRSLFKHCHKDPRFCINRLASKGCNSVRFCGVSAWIMRDINLEAR